MLLLLNIWESDRSPAPGSDGPAVQAFPASLCVKEDRCSFWLFGQLPTVYLQKIESEDLQLHSYEKKNLLGERPKMTTNFRVGIGVQKSPQISDVIG